MTSNQDYPHQRMSAQDQDALITYVKSHTQQAATIEYRNWTGASVAVAMAAVKHLQTQE